MSKKDYWTIPEVDFDCCDLIQSYDLLKFPLDNGMHRNQREWIEYSKQAKKYGDFYVGDMLSDYAILRALFKQNNTEARDFIKEQITRNYPLTLTKIISNPKGEDEAIHNEGMDYEYRSRGNIIGPDEWIKESKNRNYLISLVGTSDVNEINSVSQFINGTDAYIYRPNKKSDSPEERVAGFYASSDRFAICCSRDPRCSFPAIGIRES